MFALTEPPGTPPPGPYILSLLTPPPFSRTEILAETPMGGGKSPSHDDPFPYRLTRSLGLKKTQMSTEVLKRYPRRHHLESSSTSNDGKCLPLYSLFKTPFQRMEIGGGGLGVTAQKQKPERL